LGLIPPRLGYVYDHLRRPISGCGGWGRISAIVLSLPPVLDAGTISSLLLDLLTRWTHLTSFRKTILCITHCLGPSLTFITAMVLRVRVLCVYVHLHQVGIGYRGTSLRLYN